MKNKTLLIFAVLMVTLVFLASIAIASHSLTKWSVRGKVAVADVDNLFNHGIDSGRGQFNAWYKTGSDKGAGHFYFQGKVDGLNHRERVTVNWDWHNSKYGFNSVMDNSTETHISANARVIHKHSASVLPDVTYGVPVNITLKKPTGEFIVEADNGDFKFSI